MSSLLHQELVRALPSTLKIDRKLESGAISRAFRSFPASGSTFSPSGISTMSLTLPAIGWIDFLKSYLYIGNFSWTSTDVNAKLSRSAHSLFRRITVVIGGNTIIDSDQYDVISSVLGDVTLSADQQTTSLGMMSLFNPALRTIKSGLSISLQPLVSILRSQKLIPLHNLGSMTINFYLNSAAVAFESPAGSDVAYSLSGVKYCCDIITLSESVEALVREAYNSDKLRYHFQNWRAFPAQSQSQNYDMRIECLEKSIDGLIIVPRWAPNLTDKTANSYDRSQGSLYEVQYNIGSNLLDRHVLENGSTQPLFELEKLLDASNSTNITPAEWSSVYGSATSPLVTGSKFCLGLHCATIDDDSVMGGYSGRGQIVVSMKHSSPLANPLHYTSFILHDVVVYSGASTGTQVDH